MMWRGKIKMHCAQADVMVYRQRKRSWEHHNWFWIVDYCYIWCNIVGITVNILTRRVRCNRICNVTHNESQPYFATLFAWLWFFLLSVISFPSILIKKKLHPANTLNVKVGTVLVMYCYERINEINSHNIEFSRHGKAVYWYDMNRHLQIDWNDALIDWVWKEKKHRREIASNGDFAYIFLFFLSHQRDYY